MAFYKCGGGTDTGAVTATASDVLSGKKIVNADGDEVTGNIATYSGSTSVTANSDITLPTAKKYVASNITIKAPTMKDNGDGTYSLGAYKFTTQDRVSTATMPQGAKGDSYTQFCIWGDALYMLLTTPAFYEYREGEWHSISLPTTKFQRTPILFTAKDGVHIIWCTTQTSGYYYLNGTQHYRWNGTTWTIMTAPPLYAIYHMYMYDYAFYLQTDDEHTYIVTTYAKDIAEQSRGAVVLCWNAGKWTIVAQDSNLPRFAHQRVIMCIPYKESGTYIGVYGGGAKEAFLWQPSTNVYTIISIVNYYSSTAYHGILYPYEDTYRYEEYDGRVSGSWTRYELQNGMFTILDYPGSIQWIKGTPIINSWVSILKHNEHYHQVGSVGQYGTSLIHYILEDKALITVVPD